MDVSFSDGATRVRLSARNVRDLLAQYEHVAAGLYKGEASLFRMTDEGFLVVSVESDAIHYGERKPGPGSGLADRKEV